MTCAPDSLFSVSHNLYSPAQRFNLHKLGNVSMQQTHKHFFMSAAATVRIFTEIYCLGPFWKPWVSTPEPIPSCTASGLHSFSCRWSVFLVHSWSQLSLMGKDPARTSPSPHNPHLGKSMWLFDSYFPCMCRISLNHPQFALGTLPPW